jgi:hypothetical protein
MATLVLDAPTSTPAKNNFFSGIRIMIEVVIRTVHQNYFFCCIISLAFIMEVMEVFRGAGRLSL